jgi:hypothetical protein
MVFAVLFCSSSGVSGFLEELADGSNNMTLGQIINRLKETYCSSIGVVRVGRLSGEERAQELTLLVIVCGSNTCTCWTASSATGSAPRWSTW